MHPPPTAVSLVPHPCSISDSILKVYDIKINNTDKILAEGYYNSDQRFRYNYTVCISPLHSRSNKASQLVSSIEINRMFGADHFVFYNHSPGMDVLRVVEYYIQLGLADILPWAVPLSKPGNKTFPIHYYAQVVALNDCMYRSMIDSKYVVISDADEIIVPQIDCTWDDLIQRVTTVSFPYVWIFQNTFFRLDWKDDPQASSIAKNHQIIPLLKTNREAVLFPFEKRSKLILHPLMISIVGMHLVVKTQNNKTFQKVDVDPKYGLLHHYRNGLKKLKKTEGPVKNQVMLKYTDKITKHVVPILQLLGLTN